MIHEVDAKTICREGWKERVRTISTDLPAGSPLFPFDGRDPRAFEQYRIIRTKILHAAQPLRIIAISSPQAGDGKSVTTANVAGALSLKPDISVMLIDADFRRSALAGLLNVPSCAGLSEVLSGECSLEEAAVNIRSGGLNLYFLPAGGRPKNPSELLTSSRWLLACTEMRKQFDYCVIDTPPVGVVADYELVQPLADGIIMVVRPDHTSRGRCFTAFQTIERAKLIGFIANCVPEWFLTRSMDHEYSYYRSPE